MIHFPDRSLVFVLRSPLPWCMRFYFASQFTRESWIEDFGENGSRTRPQQEHPDYSQNIHKVDTIWCKVAKASGNTRVLRKWNRIFKSKDGHFLAILPGYLLRESWVWSFTRDQADVQVIEIYSNIFYPRSNRFPATKISSDALQHKSGTGKSL